AEQRLLVEELDLYPTVGRLLELLRPLRRRPGFGAGRDVVRGELEVESLLPATAGATARGGGDQHSGVSDRRYPCPLLHALWPPPRCAGHTAVVPSIPKWLVCRLCGPALAGDGGDLTMA